MKTYFVLALLSLSSLTWANPFCFVADGNGPEIPEEICLENIQLDLDTEIISVNDRSQILPKRLATSYLARRNENGFSFRASHPYINSWEGGCKEGLTVMINLRGRTDNDGLVEWLELSATYEHTVDNCHSPIQTGTILYKR